ncbi:asparaginase [Myxococcota bacterium]|nr:asparaginase [Myxococcota bacterium]MBU1535011.1 asparaginase [Myxococcota bacterium]
MYRPKILHIATGGTIAMAKGEDGSLAPIESNEDLLKMVPEIDGFAQVHTIRLSSFDSADLSPPFWLDLARVIHEEYENYDGFVVSHGTDTMAYSAAALSYILQELDKPVVLTGSQIAIGVIGSDGKRNLVNAFRVATSDIAEVMVVFGSKIIRGVRARKISAFSLEAFESINENAIGEIGLQLRFSKSRATRRAGRRLLYTPAMEPSVGLVTIHPGLRGEVLEYMVDHHEGVILLGYGTGNIPVREEDSLVSVVKAATQKGKPVVVGTQCVLGSTNLSLYKVGKNVMNAGAIPSVDMTPEAALVKLMWVLGQTKDLSRVESMMMKSYCGEISKQLELTCHV